MKSKKNKIKKGLSKTTKNEIVSYLQHEMAMETH